MLQKSLWRWSVIVLQATLVIPLFTKYYLLPILITYYLLLLLLSLGIIVVVDPVVICLFCSKPALIFILRLPLTVFADLLYFILLDPVDLDDIKDLALQVL